MSKVDKQFTDYGIKHNEIRKSRAVTKGIKDKIRKYHKKSKKSFEQKDDFFVNDVDLNTAIKASEQLSNDNNDAEFGSIDPNTDPGILYLFDILYMFQIEISIKLCVIRIGNGITNEYGKITTKTAM